MPIPGLLIGIALPWLAGALVLKLLNRDGPQPGAVLRAAGFGWFFGVAFLAFALRIGNRVSGALSWWSLAALLSILAAGAAWRLRRRASPAVNDESPGAPGLWLAALALGSARSTCCFPASS